MPAEARIRIDSGWSAGIERDLLAPPGERRLAELAAAAPVTSHAPGRGLHAGLALLLGLPALASCLAGPDYEPPTVEVAQEWLDFSGPGSPRAEDAAWWYGFDDPVLATLVESALDENLSLRQAGLRVIQSRALLGIAVGEAFPQTQELAGSAFTNRPSENSGDGRSKDYRVGIDAAWELDFWGRYRRGIESADAALEASVADYDAVLVLLAADVASRYVQIRSVQEQLELTAANIGTQRDTLELTRVRFDAGAVSELDVATAEATLANTESILPGLQDELRAHQLALCVLLGRPPSQLENVLGPPQPIPEAPAVIALGIPADLLRRRPDVRRAERTAASLSAQIGVAAADLYPAFSLSGSTGFSVSTSSSSPLDVGDLFDADSFEGFLGLEFHWPFLNYGRIRNNIRFADAAFQEAVEAYRNAVLEAAADVETGLSNFLRSREQADLLGQSVEAARRTVELSLVQYRGGAVDFLRVNQAQQDLVDRQNSLAVARANVALGAIATYRALGGGWETRADREFVPQETIEEMRERTSWGDMLAEEEPRPSETEDPEQAVATAGVQPVVPAPLPKEMQHDEPR